MNKPIYILSGLGTDERVFQLLDFSGYEVTFIKWTIPKGDETIEEYAKSLLSQITTPKPIIIGLSFGGIMAIEIAKQIETEKVILIASAKTKYEIPFYYRWMGILRLQRIIPTHKFKKSNPVTNWLFGTSCDFDKDLLKNILNDIDPVFLKWALDKIIYWKNETILANIHHIHGTKDRVLPLVTCNTKIIGGGHFMTINKATEMTEKIRRLL